MANDQNPSLSIECSDHAMMSAYLPESSTVRHHDDVPQRSTSLDSPIRAAAALGIALTPTSATSFADRSPFIGRSASVDTGYFQANDDELNGHGDHYGGLVGSPVSSQGSIDLLAKEYDEMTLTDSDDDEQLHSDKKVHRHARKIARGYLEIKKDFEKLKAKHESHWTFAPCKSCKIPYKPL